MKDIIDFLSELRNNNNREWFEANRPRYKAVNEQFIDLTQRLITSIGEFDPSIARLTIKDCTYRIYRDTRFSSDKTPYKTHMGIYLCREGKKSGYAGYYLHIEPKGVGFLGGHLLAAGLYCPEPKVLKSVREEIFANGDKIQQAMEKAPGFVLDQSQKLKKVPRDFPSDTKYGEYLKLKDFTIMKPMNDKFMLAKDLVEQCTAEFRRVKEFNDILNRAVEFAYEE